MALREQEKKVDIDKKISQFWAGELMESDEFTQELIDELVKLRAKLADVGSQEPVAYQMREPGRLEVMHTRNPNDAKRMEDKGLIITPLVPAYDMDMINHHNASMPTAQTRSKTRRALTNVTRERNSGCDCS